MRTIHTDPTVGRWPDHEAGTNLECPSCFDWRGIWRHPVYAVTPTPAPDLPAVLRRIQLMADGAFDAEDIDELGYLRVLLAISETCLEAQDPVPPKGIHESGGNE